MAKYYTVEDHRILNQHNKEIIKRLERIKHLLLPRTIKKDKPVDCIGKCQSDKSINPHQPGTAN